MEALADALAGRARVARVDIEPDNPVLEAFGAHGVPTVLVFRDGVEVDRRTEERLRKRIEAALERARKTLHRSPAGPATRPDMM